MDKEKSEELKKRCEACKMQDLLNKDEEVSSNTYRVITFLLDVRHTCKPTMD